MAAPLFSVIIPTRNRPNTFETAFRSVLDQEYPGFEVIVVEDGSADSEHSRYHSLVEKTSGLAKLISLRRTDRGHGPSYGRNHGSFLATGDYLCFLDDDDEWTDPGHLGRVAEVIADSSKRPQLILANQKAFRNGVPVPHSVWIEDLAERLKEKTNRSGAYTVTASELLTCSAHCHVNSMVVLRSFFVNLSGFDDSLRYEEDRDFYLRAIPRTQSSTYLLLLPVIMYRTRRPGLACRHACPSYPSG